jgi:RimJ/RimL family protein N-acetyltransferase
MTFTHLQTPRLTIRRVTPADLSRYMDYRTYPYDMTEDRARSLIDRMQGLDPGVPGQWFLFGVELAESHILIGDCAFLVSQEEPREAELGYILDPAYHGKGLAFEAASAVLDYAFDAFNLHRVIAHVDIENAPSIRVLERLGFRREAHFVRNYWFKEKWIDEYLYATLQEEWTARERK